MKYVRAYGYLYDFRSTEIFLKAVCKSGDFEGHFLDNILVQ